MDEGRFSRDVLLQRRNYTKPPGPSYLLLPTGLVAAETATATFEEEALCALLQLAGRPLTFRELLQTAEVLKLAAKDHRHKTWENSRSTSECSKSNDDDLEENQDQHDHQHDRNFSQSCSLEHLIRASLRRRPDLFHLEPISLNDMKVTLVGLVPLKYFQIPLAKIMGPPLLADTSTAHLKWMSKALDSEKRYLALFDQDGPADSSRLCEIASMQDALLTMVYGHVRKKMKCMSRLQTQSGGKEDLMRAFKQHVSQDGYLSAQAVRAELDAACALRRMQQQQLLKDQEIGGLFTNQMRMQLFVNTTIWIAVSLLPIVTFHDLETTIMKGADFKHLHGHGAGFADSGLGSLMYHPMVLHFLHEKAHTEAAHSIPSEFPKISGEQLMHLMVEGWLKNDSFSEKKFEQSWSVEAGLAHAAEYLGLPHYSHIGVYVQREHVLKTVVKHALQRRRALLKHMDKVLKEKTFEGHLGCRYQWDSNRWLPFLQKLSSLKSVSEQLFCVRQVLLQEVESQDPVAIVENLLAPLLLIATSAAHVATVQKQKADAGDAQDVADVAGDTARQSLARGVEKVQRLLRQSSLEEVAEAIRKSFPEEKNFAKALWKGEQELLRLSGLKHSSELPVSLAELMNIRPELAEALPRAEGRAESLSCGESEQVVLQHLLAALNTNTLAEQMGQPSLNKVLKAVGQCEDEVCRQCGVANFSELKLGLNYGRFLSQNVSEVGSVMEQLFSSGQESRIATDLVNFCDHLKATGCDAAEARQAIWGHFGAAVSGKEVDSAWQRATSINVKLMAPAAHIIAAKFHVSQIDHAVESAIDHSNLIQQAVEEIASAPFLMDLRLVLDWAKFQSVGVLEDFLFSPDFMKAWSNVGGNCQVISLRWQHFVRLPSGCAEDFHAALKAKDPAAASGSVLMRWLQDGLSFRHHQFLAMAEDAMRGWSSGMRESFVLQSIAVLPMEWRDAVAPVLAKAYLQLGLPKSEMILSAKRRPEWTASLRWLAKYAGVTDWELKWGSSYPADVGCSVEDGPAMFGGLHRAKKSTSLGKKMENSEVDSSDGGIISEGTEDEDRDTVRDEEAENRKLCRRIARNKGVKFQDVDPVTRKWLKQPVSAVFRSLQQTVQGAVRRLADDLYSGEVHFMLELLQNADDCDFADNVLPSLTVTFETDPEKFAQWTTFEPAKPAVAFLIVEHNETGFRDFNLKALCDIAQSTKAGSARKFIGAKGIGFKSVFCATSTPILHSGQYHCHFDSEALDGLGYLIPFPLQRPRDFQFGTRLVLPLYYQTTVDKCRRVVEDLRPELLLFLRKLDKITIMDQVHSIQKEIQKANYDDTGEVVKLQTSIKTTSPGNLCEETSQVLWRVHRHSVPLPMPSMPSMLRADAQNVELQIAFPRTSKNLHHLEQLPAFAWLPLRSYGFRFILQADWAVPSSREAILAENPMNQCLRAALPDAFCDLIEGLANRALASSDEAERAEEFHRLYQIIPLPGETAEFFVDSPRGILAGLAKRKFILVQKGSGSCCVTPAEVVRSELQSSAQACPMTSDPDVQRVLEDILNGCNLFFEKGLISKNLAKELHISELNGSIAYKCLESLSQREELQMPAVLPQNRVISDLELKLIHFLLQILAAANISPSDVEQLRRLRIIPTESGKLSSLDQKVYIVDERMASTLQGYAEGLNLKFKQMMSKEVELFLTRRLGVQQTDSVRFLNDACLARSVVLTNARRSVVLTMLGQGAEDVE